MFCLCDSYGCGSGLGCAVCVSIHSSNGALFLVHNVEMVSECWDQLVVSLGGMLEYRLDLQIVLHVLLIAVYSHRLYIYK